MLSSRLISQAAPATILPGIEVSATPYLWLPWISAGIRPADTRLSSVSDTIGAGKVIDHLTWVPFMGQAEFRSGPYGVVFDYIHAPLKSGISTRNILFGGGTGDFTLNTGSAVFLYRVLALPDQNADIGLGFRAWGLDGANRLKPAEAAVASRNNSQRPLLGRPADRRRATIMTSETGLVPRLLAILAALVSGRISIGSCSARSTMRCGPGSTCMPVSGA